MALSMRRPPSSPGRHMHTQAPRPLWEAPLQTARVFEADGACHTSGRVSRVTRVRSSHRSHMGQHINFITRLWTTDPGATAYKLLQKRRATAVCPSTASGRLATAIVLTLQSRIGSRAAWAWATSCNSFSSRTSGTRGNTKHTSPGREKNLFAAPIAPQSLNTDTRSTF